MVGEMDYVLVTLFQMVSAICTCISVRAFQFIKSYKNPDLIPETFQDI